MLIVALVLAVIGLAALVTAVVTSNEVVAWVCIAASALGVVLLIIDAVRERAQGRLAALADEADEADEDADDAEADEAAPFIADSDTEFIEYSAEVVDPVIVDPVTVDPVIVAEDHPEELIHDEPEYDLPSDDEPEFAASAEESAIHIIEEQSATDPAVDDQIVVLQSDDPQLDDLQLDDLQLDNTRLDNTVDSTAVIEYGDTGYDRDAR
jgi:hypothetical protein